MIITIIGNIGSGKSTALPIIAEVINADMLDADDLFQTSDPFAKAYLENQERWALANELWLTFERTKLIEEALLSQEHKNVLIDSGLLISWVYTYGHFVSGTITKDEWELYQRIYDRFSSNWWEGACVIYLDYSVPTLLERIKKRGRGFELEFYTAAYLEKINRGLKALVQKLRKQKSKIITISEEEIGDFENNEEDRKKLLKIIQKALNL